MRCRKPVVTSRETLNTCSCLKNQFHAVSSVYHALQPSYSSVNYDNARDFRFNSLGSYWTRADFQFSVHCLYNKELWKRTFGMKITPFGVITTIPIFNSAAS